MGLKRKKVSVKLSEMLAAKLDYPVDAMRDVPSIHIMGRESAVIECCKGVLVYTESKLTLDMGDYALTLHGRELVLESMNRAALTVRGALSAVTLDGRETEKEE